MVINIVEEKSEEVETLTDQSSFTASQAVLQAPPLKSGDIKSSRKNTLLFIGIGVCILFVTLFVLRPPQQRIITPITNPSPSPSATETTSLMKQKLDELNTELQNSNPDSVLEAPPQVDMEIDF